MKKLLVLALVLSMATMANATLHISVNGVMDGTATLHPSDTATLAIWTDAPIAFGSGDQPGAALVANVAEADFSGGVPNAALNEPGLAVFQSASNDIGVYVPTYPDQDGLGFMIIITGNPLPANSMLFDQIILHCDAGNGPMVVTLWGTQDYAQFNVLAQATITQVTPEPFTMGLLGLGGLFLRRRK